MRWEQTAGDGYELLTPPQDKPTLAQVRSALSIESEQTEDDRTLDFIRRAVVRRAEYRLHRAIYPQTRRYTAVYGRCENPVREYRLEPFLTADPAPVVELNGVALPFSAAGGRTITLDTVLHPSDGDRVAITIRAGFVPQAEGTEFEIPPDLFGWLVQECNAGLERKRQKGSKNTERLLIESSGIRRFRVFNEPLEEYLVEVGAGGRYY